MTYDLQKQKILVTREEKQAKSFAEQIKKYNGIPIIAPLLKIERIDRNENEPIFQQLNQYDWIFFTSANGVNHFIEQLDETEKEKFALISKAVVGHKTEEALKNHGYQANFIPTVYNAEVMANEFLTEYKGKGPILLVRGNIARNVLPNRFTEAKIPFDSLIIYETVHNTSIKSQLNEILHDHLDFITFTSPSTIDAFKKIADKDCRQYTCVTIGTTTKKRAEAYSFHQILTPKEFTIEGMIQVMSDYLKKERIN